MTEKLIKYIENEIFPIYNKNEKGHGIEHIKYVIDRSIKFAEEIGNLNLDIAYTVAAYHDIMHHISKKEHETLSAKFLREDIKIKEFFNEEEIKIISDAIEDHRAKLNGEPRSIYGKIISSADRNVLIEQPFLRTYTYRTSMDIVEPIDAIIEESHEILVHKYGETGYATEKIYFGVDEYKDYIKELQYYLNNKPLFIKKYIELNNIDLKNHDFKSKDGDISVTTQINYQEELLVVYKELYGSFEEKALSISEFLNNFKCTNINNKTNYNAFLSLKYYPGDATKKFIDDLTNILAKLSISTFVAVRDIEKYGEVKDLDMKHFMPKYAFPKMKESDFIIIEYSESGAGLGMGAAYCYANNVPVYLIAKTGSNISTTVNSVAQKVIFYDTLDDVYNAFKDLKEKNLLRIKTRVD